MPSPPHALAVDVHRRDLERHQAFGVIDAPPLEHTHNPLRPGRHGAGVGRQAWFDEPKRAKHVGLIADQQSRTRIRFHCRTIGSHPSSLRHGRPSLRHALRHGAVRDGGIARRLEMPALQIPQRAAQLALPDLLTAVEQFLEKPGHEFPPLLRPQRPGNELDVVNLGVTESERHGRDRCAPNRRI
jgi:hypothetical protein